MRGTLHAVKAIAVTPSDTSEVSGYPVGFYVGGDDGSEEAAITVGWKTAGGGTTVTCLFRCPVGTLIPIAGFNYVMSTGTTLATTNGQVVVLFGPPQR